MKTNIKMTAALTALSILVPQQLAFAAADACKDICNRYKNAMGDFPKNGSAPTKISRESLFASCPLPPDLAYLARKPTIDLTVKSTDDKWNKCLASAGEDWKVLGQHCDVIDILGDGRTAGEVGAIAYTIAAAACTGACVAESTVVASPFVKGLCIGTGIAAAVTDVVGSLAVEKAGEGLLTIAGSLSGVVGVAGNVGMLAAEGIGSRIASSCVAGTFLTTAAILKWKNFSNMGDQADRECQHILDMDSGSDLPVGQGGGPSPTPGGFPPGGASGGGPGHASGGGSGGSGGGYAGFGGSEGDNLNGPKYAAASEGPFGAIFKALPKDKIQDAVQQAAGLNLADIAKRLKSESPGAIVASISGGGDAVTSAIKDIEKEIKDGKFRMKDEAIAAFSSGGGKGATAAKAPAPNPFALLGNHGVAATAPSELKFEKTKKDPALLENGDIWHEGYSGSIFQIISGTLGKTRDRVDKLEWETPLNRALAGLPTKKDGKR